MAIIYERKDRPFVEAWASSSSTQDKLWPNLNTRNHVIKLITKGGEKVSFTRNEQLQLASDFIFSHYNPNLPCLKNRWYIKPLKYWISFQLFGFEIQIFKLSRKR